MKKIIVAIPHSHTWLWTQTCIASLMRNPPKVEGYNTQVVVVNNSPWSPSALGISLLGGQDYDFTRATGRWFDTPLLVMSNYKSNKFHASALDCIVESCEFDYLMAWETDVLALRPTWLQWFLDQMRDTDYAVGHWHHESFINPSCTLYRGDALREMQTWCKHRPDPNEMRWGSEFSQCQFVTDRMPEKDYVDWYDQNIAWVAGPFADKRGWPAGTVLKETPSGQLKGPGWYEPGQMLHHWAVERSYTYTVCKTNTAKIPVVTGGEMAIQTLYGPDINIPSPNVPLNPHELFGSAETVHLWGGTRALDIIKHEVHDPFVSTHTPWWLTREARFWKEIVPKDVQKQTLELIRRYGWYYRGAGTPDVTQRDRDAAEFVRACYREGGVEW